ncbi:metallophosphoesterase family protein [[Clostridium] colinum]|uniref:metallophosphoesterase family protein n=1 Tax=[Clostridium] colinum TaxID=36835 RepID=UPI0020254F5A|nr:exonuclease subunit SbcD [[Clostridium] colinum]
MKILHTSDWHLGKYLDKYSRIEEQEKFIQELEKICDKEQIDLIIIAGDIYDTTNPPILAEKIFFKAMKSLSLNGKRPIVIVSGNHDSASKLVSPSPLAYEFGIIIQGMLNTVANVGDYGNFKITKSGEGFFEIEINGEKAVFLTIPYITEKNINEVIFKSDEEVNMQKEFSDKIKEILENLAKNYGEDTINIIVSHLFVKGGIETDSERKIQSIGGTYAIDPKVFPKKTQYVALGHLHRCQQVKKSDCLAYYSGSPIRYSQSEVGYEKVVLVLDIQANKQPILKKVPLTDYKPIDVFKCNSYEEALQHCEQVSNKDSYTFIEILTENFITGEQIRTLREIKKDIVSIILKTSEEEKVIYECEEEKSILEEFKDFYTYKRGKEAPDEVLDTFLNILDEIEKEEVKENETTDA